LADEIDDPIPLPAGGEHLRRPARPTLKTISEITGLGVTTVSRALKDGPELRSETKARVQAVAAELGYRPDRAGVRLRTGRTFVIGLVLDQTVAIAEFERQIVLGVSQALYGTPYHLVILPQLRDADPMEPVRYFVETAAADGIIFTHTRPLDSRVRYLLDRRFPFITHGRTEFGEPHPFYDFDNERFVAAAVRRLHERGRRRIALLPAPRYLTCAHHMLDGFRRGIAETGVAGTVINGVHLDSETARFRRAAARIAAADPPDGIICANETGCIALMAGLREAGLTVGRDVDVIAKSITDVLDYLSPPIDSFFEDHTFSGEELARLLLRRIAGAPVSELQSVAAPRFCRRTK
jgi:LacI family transcriptional regulator, galactose operon repressor